MGILGEFIEKSKGMNIHGVKVYKDGEYVEEYFPNGDFPVNQYSIAKSVASAAAGFAVDEGLFSLEDNMMDFFRDYDYKKSDYLEMVKIKHLLTMSYGVSESLLMMGQREALMDIDWVTYSLNQTIDRKPGEKFYYSNIPPYLLGVIIARASGSTLLDYVDKRLFSKIGIDKPEWETDPKGYTFASSGLMLSTADIMKFGILYLNDGMWDGKQLLRKDWIRQSMSKQIKVKDITASKEVGNEENNNENAGNEEGSLSYGYLFWENFDGSFSADGKDGQHVLILRDKNAVVAINSNTEQDVKALFFETVYKGL